MKKASKPRAARSEHQFDANLVVVKKSVLAFGEVDKKRAPINTLMIHVGGHPMFTFNEQANTRCAHDIDTVELTDTSLRVVYAKGAGPSSGGNQLRSVRVNFKATKKQLASMQKALESLEDADDTHH